MGKRIQNGVDGDVFYWNGSGPSGEAVYNRQEVFVAVGRCKGNEV